MAEKTTMYDKYLDEEVREHFIYRNQWNPREWVIVHLIYDDKPLEEAPFEIADLDREFYTRVKAEYEERKAKNPDFYFCFLPEDED